MVFYREGKLHTIRHTPSSALTIIMKPSSKETQYGGSVIDQSVACGGGQK